MKTVISRKSSPIVKFPMGYIPGIYLQATRIPSIHGEVQSVNPTHSPMHLNTVSFAHDPLSSRPSVGSSFVTDTEDVGEGRRNLRACLDRRRAFLTQEHQTLALMRPPKLDFLPLQGVETPSLLAYRIIVAPSILAPDPWSVCLSVRRADSRQRWTYTGRGTNDASSADTFDAYTRRRRHPTASTTRGRGPSSGASVRSSAIASASAAVDRTRGARTQGTGTRRPDVVFGVFFAESQSSPPLPNCRPRKRARHATVATPSGGVSRRISVGRSVGCHHSQCCMASCQRVHISQSSSSSSSSSGNSPILRGLESRVTRTRRPSDCRRGGHHCRDRIHYTEHGTSVIDGRPGRLAGP